MKWSKFNPFWPIGVFNTIWHLHTILVSFIFHPGVDIHDDPVLLIQCIEYPPYWCGFIVNIIGLLVLRTFNWVEFFHILEGNPRLLSMLTIDQESPYLSSNISYLPTFGFLHKISVLLNCSLFPSMINHILHQHVPIDIPINLSI